MIDFEALAEAVISAATRALVQGASAVEGRAKQLAPVRNVFEGDEYSFRIKTIGERSRDSAFLGTKSAEGMGMAMWTVTGKRIPRRWSQRRASTAQRLLGEYQQEVAARRLGKPPEPAVLSRRGASEVRTGRANYSTWGRTHVGGRLRGEIHVADPSISGDGAEVWVISPTPYAKFQEIGTRHNRAHPYMRPAADESRGAVVRAVSDAVRGASRKGSRKMTIKAEVRL